MGDVIVLGIESATARAGVALGTPDGVIASAQVTRGPRHAEVLMPAIDFVCVQAGIAIGDVDVIAVDVGPGLFTGLRVGIATANGLAQALGKPMIGVCSLDLLARAVLVTPCDVVSVIDARRREVYAARYGIVGGELKRVMEPAVLPPAELMAQVGDALLVGDTLLEHGAIYALPSAETLVEIARDLPFQEPNSIVPNYLRKSDAELNAERGSSSGS